MPVEPSAQRDGIELGSVRNEFQSGKGTAAPTHVIDCVEFDRPVELTAELMSCDGAMF